MAYATSACGVSRLAALYLKFENERRLLVIEITCDFWHNDP